MNLNQQVSGYTILLEKYVRMNNVGVKKVSSDTLRVEIQNTAENMGVDLATIEKDYWVSLIRENGQSMKKQLLKN